MITFGVYAVCDKCGHSDILIIDDKNEVAPIVNYDCQKCGHNQDVKINFREDQEAVN